MCCFNLHGFARCILENQKNELTAWRLKEKELQKPEVTPWFLAPMTERGAAASREGQVLRENCLEGPLVSFFFFFGPRCHYFALTFEGQFLWVCSCGLAGYTLPCFDVWSHCSLPSLASVGQPAVSGLFC